jgi:hypothetical protein
VQFGVAVGSLRESFRGAGVGVDPPVGPLDAGAGVASGLLRGGGGERGVGEQVVDRGEQGEVALAVEGGEEVLLGGGSAAGEVPGDLGVDGAEDQLVR